MAWLFSVWVKSVVYRVQSVVLLQLTIGWLVGKEDTLFRMFIPL